MKNFDEIKKEIIDIAKENEACVDDFQKAIHSTNFQELLNVIVNNANWCYKYGILSEEILSQIPDKKLIDAGIFYKKRNVKQIEGFAIYYNSTSEHYNDSTSKHYNDSTSKHYDDSTSKHYDNSTSKHYYNSTSEHYNDSTSKHYDDSTSVCYNDSINHKIENKAILKDYYHSKIFIKKSKFEIVEL